MSDNWLDELDRRFAWTIHDFRRTVRMACSGLAPTDADDVFQDVAISLGFTFRAGIPRDIPTKDKLNAYVFCAARNQKYKFLSGRASKHKHELPLNPTSEEGKKPVYNSKAQEKEVVLTALTQEERETILALLPPHLREYLRLLLEGKTGLEIAQKLGESQATVSRRLQKCKKFIDKDSLAEIFETSSIGPQ